MWNSIAAAAAAHECMCLCIYVKQWNSDCESACIQSEATFSKMPWLCAFTMWNKLLIWWHIHVFWCIARQNEHENSDTDTLGWVCNCHSKHANAIGMSQAVAPMLHFIILNGESAHKTYFDQAFSLSANGNYTSAWSVWTACTQTHAQLSFIQLRAIVVAIRSDAMLLFFFVSCYARMKLRLPASSVALAMCISTLQLPSSVLNNACFACACPLSKSDCALIA